jgi:predicted transcriptional regulator
VAAGKSTRLNITLPPEHALKLARLAERTHVQEGTLARSLLVQAIDETDLDPRHVADVLDGIPGAWDRIERGLEDARAGRTIPLTDL